MDNINKLKQEFKKIENKDWIKGIIKGPGSIGLTFGKELGIKQNKFEIPDYNGIEIKTKKKTGTSNTTLFNATFDGKYLFETKRLVKEYG